LALRPTVKSSSRILALKLEELPAAGFKRPAKVSSLKAVAEGFLKYSPRVQMRAPWVFVDIASTSHLFHGEEGLMRSAMNLARDLGFGVQCAVADTPAGAQAFASAHPFYNCPPGEERDRLKELSLPLLLQLEGLEKWAKPSTVESIITFFMMLGFTKAGDLSRFTFSSLQERWGEVGGLLWKRLNAQDRPAISPLISTEPLQDYVHLDFPVSLVSLLLHQAQKSLDFLFARLQGRRLFAQKLTLTLHCEYSKAQHKILLEPNTPSRDRDLFVTLLERKLSDLNLENPIRDFEIHVIPCPERSQQLDFFEPRTTDQDKLQTLFSLLLQSSLTPGFYRIEPSILPERGWRLVASPSELYRAEKEETKSPTLAVAPEPRYGESVMRAPRPTRLLRTPKSLTIEELQKIRILTTNPIERLEDAWWEKEHQSRDYYFAVSSEGQCLWIYQDPRTEEYFLHGYFD
jgi:protein ImuB